MKKHKIMWTIKQIFDGDYGCEERNGSEPMVSVTLADENGNERYVTVPDSFLTANSLDVGSEWTNEEDLNVFPDNLHLL